MTNRLRAILIGLRIYGPCSNVELARRLNRDRELVYRAVYELRDMGLADRLGACLYDVSDKGRAEVFRESPRPIEQDAAMLPLGWD